MTLSMMSFSDQPLPQRHPPHPVPGKPPLPTAPRPPQTPKRGPPPSRPPSTGNRPRTDHTLRKDTEDAPEARRRPVRIATKGPQPLTEKSRALSQESPARANRYLPPARYFTTFPSATGTATPSGAASPLPPFFRGLLFRPAR